MIYKIYIKPLSQQLAVFEKKEKSCKIRKKYILMNLSKDTKKRTRKEVLAQSKKQNLQHMIKFFSSCVVTCFEAITLYSTWTIQIDMNIPLDILAKVHWV
jgi:hypothetical protein